MSDVPSTSGHLADDTSSSNSDKSSHHTRNGLLPEQIRRILREVNSKLLEEYKAVKPLLSIKDVADTLYISKRTAETLLEDGDLPKPLWIGGQRRWHPETIEAYLRSQE